MHSPHEHTLKNNHIALKCRLDGNEYFRKFKFFEAMENYNKSICYAEPHSDMLALAYGNRSAVYSTVQMYDLCLENIAMARACRDNPQDNIAILDVREDKVKKLMLEHRPDPENDPFSFFKLSYPSHANNPYIASCLEIHVNEKYGRHIITNQDLKPGDIVVMEETPFKGLEKVGAYVRCANCFKSNKMSLIPMAKCASGKDRVLSLLIQYLHNNPHYSDVLFK